MFVKHCTFRLHSLLIKCRLGLHWRHFIIPYSIVPSIMIEVLQVWSFTEDKGLWFQKALYVSEMLIKLIRVFIAVITYEAQNGETQCPMCKYNLQVITSTSTCGEPSLCLMWCVWSFLCLRKWKMLLPGNREKYVFVSFWIREW